MIGDAMFRFNPLEKYLPINSSTIALFQKMVPTWQQIEQAIEKENWVESLVLLQRWLQFHPKDGQAWYKLGDICYLMMNFEEMAKCFLNALKYDTTHESDIKKKKEISWSFLISEGIKFNREKDEEQALRNFILAAKILPERFIAYKLAGETAYNIGNLYSAQDLLKKALNIQPNDAECRTIYNDLFKLLSSANRPTGMNIK